MRALLRCVSAAKRKRQKRRRCREQLPPTAPFVDDAPDVRANGDAADGFGLGGTPAAAVAPVAAGGIRHEHAAGAAAAARAAGVVGEAAAAHAGAPDVRDFAGAGHQRLFEVVKRRKCHHVVLRNAWPAFSPGAVQTANTRAWTDAGAGTAAAQLLLRVKCCDLVLCRRAQTRSSTSQPSTCSRTSVGPRSDARGASWPLTHLPRKAWQYLTRACHVHIRASPAVSAAAACTCVRVSSLVLSCCGQPSHSKFTPSRVTRHRSVHRSVLDFQARWLPKVYSGCTSRIAQRHVGGVAAYATRGVLAAHSRSGLPAGSLCNTKT